MIDGGKKGNNYMKTAVCGLFIVLNIFFLIQANDTNDDEVYLVIETKNMGSYSWHTRNAHEVKNLLFNRANIWTVEGLVRSKKLPGYIIIEKSQDTLCDGGVYYVWEYYLAVLLKKSQVTRCDKIKYDQKTLPDICKNKPGIPQGGDPKITVFSYECNSVGHS